jgi:hypothetical protein
MKKTIQIICGVALFSLAACDKDALKLNDKVNAAFGVIHAAPGAPTVDIVVNGLVANGSRRLAYRTVSAGGGTGNGGIYMPIEAGTGNIKISPDSGKTNVVNADLVFATNSASTIVVYDTLAATGAPLLRFVQLSDDLTAPATGNVHVRFLHLAPLAPTVDVTLIRGTNVDSVTLTNRSYIGATPNAATLSTFAPITGGAVYTYKIKLAGTQTVVLTGSLAANLTAGRIVTISAVGSAKGQALGALVARHL